MKNHIRIYTPIAEILFANLNYLKSTQVSFQDNGSGVAKITQDNEYYSFGMSMQGITIRTTANSGPIVNRHLLNAGSEIQDGLGFENSYSTPNREYDQVLGWFNSIDQMVDKYAAWTPITSHLMTRLVITILQALIVIRAYNKPCRRGKLADTNRKEMGDCYECSLCRVQP